MKLLTNMLVRSSVRPSLLCCRVTHCVRTATVGHFIFG